MTWPADISKLAQAIDKLSADDLPAPPFVLQPHITIGNTVTWIEQIQREVKASPSHPRFITGALVEDLRWLKHRVKIIRAESQGQKPPELPQELRHQPPEGSSWSASLSTKPGLKAAIQAALKRQGVSRQDLNQSMKVARQCTLGTAKKEDLEWALSVLHKQNH